MASDQLVLKPAVPSTQQGFTPENPARTQQNVINSSVDTAP